MATCTTVLSRGAALLCSHLAPSSECRGSHHQAQQQQLQLRNLRHFSNFSTPALRMCTPSCCSSSKRASTSSQWGSSSSSSSNSQAEGSKSSSIGAIHGVAGVQAETTDEVAGSRRTGLSIGKVTVQGLREEMEDDILVQDGPLGFTYAAVFDGHAGFAAAQFLRDELYKECIESLQGGKLLESDDRQIVEDALVRAFHETDSRLLSWLEANSKHKDAGSTATVVFIRSGSVTVAHVGDSRAVLSRSGKAVDLSGDHRPYGSSKISVAEVKRVKEEGGWITNGRLCSMLAVSRAFGDFAFKEVTKKMELVEEGISQRRWTRPFVQKLNFDGIWLSVTPDVNQIQLDEEAEFIIIATDGLWDSFRSKDAVQFVRKQLKKHGDVQQAAEAIAQATLERHGEDNIGVIILDLGKIPQEEPGLKLKWW